LPQREPERIFAICRFWLSNVLAHAALAGAELNELNLRLGQAAMVRATLAEREYELNAVIFPKADRADVVRARRGLKNFKTAAWACVHELRLS
jgi:hypothetical protein